MLIAGEMEKSVAWYALPVTVKDLFWSHNPLSGAQTATVLELQVVAGVLAAGDLVMQT